MVRRTYVSCQILEHSNQQTKLICSSSNKDFDQKIWFALDVGVMHEVIRRVKEEAELDVRFDVDDADLNSKQRKAIKNNAAAKLVNGLIDRGVVKRTVMTSVYGVTYIGARQQIQEKIEEKVRIEHFCCFLSFAVLFRMCLLNFVYFKIFSAERERIRY